MFNEAVKALSQGFEVVCIYTSERIKLSQNVGVYINGTHHSIETFIRDYADEQFRIDETTNNENTLN